MPRLHGVRERHDLVLYDTHRLEPGQRVSAFGSDCPVGDFERTNMLGRGQMPHDQTVAILALGLRLVGKTVEEEDLLLDHLRLTVWIGDRPFGAYPGSLCSTFRYYNGRDDVHINELMSVEKDADAVRRGFVPGYVAAETPHGPRPPSVSGGA